MQNFLNRQSIKQAIKQLDIGGVHPVHTVDKSENTYKSVAGGLVSFLIMSLSSAYTLYVLINWYSGQILPTSQTSKRTIDYEEFSFDYNPISWVFTQPPTQNMIDPFQDDQLILIPIVQILSDIYISPPNIIQPKPFLKNTQKISLNESKLTQNLSMSHNPIQENNRPPYKNETQFLVTFLKCQPQLIQANQRCANDTIMSDYFNTGGKSVVMSVHFQEFVESNLSFVSREKPYYFLLDDTQGLYTQVVLRTKNMTVSHGILFQKEIHNNFLYSVEVQTQTISKNEFVKLYGVEGYASFLVRLDSVKEYEDISFPTLGVVGAQIGSIINVLLWMKMLIIYYNTKQYQNKLVGVIMSLTQIEDSNKQVNSSNQINSQNQIQTTNQIKQRYQWALEKTNIFNVHIELTKMRTILDQIVEKDQIQNQNPNHFLIQSQIPNEALVYKLNENQIFQSKNNLFSPQSRKPDKPLLIEMQSQDFVAQDDKDRKFNYMSPMNEEKFQQSQEKLISDNNILSRQSFHQERQEQHAKYLIDE